MLLAPLTASVCLALNVYHEARGEPIIGQYAVAQTTLNRVQGNPDRVCKAVFKPKQFSWTGHKTKIPAGQPWKTAQIVASAVLSGKMRYDLTNGATHYHGPGVKPVWASKLKHTTTIGRHRFYA